jgi:hypothetical protein
MLPIAPAPCVTAVKFEPSVQAWLCLDYPRLPRPPGLTRLVDLALQWSDLFGVGDDDDLTDEGIFHGGVEEKVGDVCARG